MCIFHLVLVDHRIPDFRVSTTITLSCQIFSVEVVQLELWPIAWKQSTVIWNLQTSLFQLLSNILVYKNHHVYIFLCKVLSVVFKASSTILSMKEATRNWRFVTTPTPLSRTSWKFFISHSVLRHANWLLCLLLARFDHFVPCFNYVW